MRQIRVFQRAGTICGIPVLVDPEMQPDQMDLVQGNDLNRVLVRLRLEQQRPPAAEGDRKEQEP